MMYFKDPDKTEEAMKGGWFHSGDVGIMDEDRYITVADRKKDMIKTGGENVPTREVEDAIYKDPRVQEVAVIGIPHPKWVEAVTAIIVPKAGQTIHREGDHRAVPQGAGGLQGPEGDRLRAGPAQDPHGQDPQAGTAADVQQIGYRQQAPGEQKIPLSSPFEKGGQEGDLISDA